MDDKREMNWSRQTERPKNTLLRERQLYHHLWELYAQNAARLPAEKNEQMRQVLSTLRRHLYFRVYIMGNMGSGKTSLANALLGEKLLPARVLPTTALVTEIVYGEDRRAVLYPYQQTAKAYPREIGINEIESYIGWPKTEYEAFEPGYYFPQWRKIEITLPCPIVDDRLCLVDCPPSYKRFFDAALILHIMPACTPCSLIDKDMIQQFREQGHKILFVITKMDLITEDDCAKLERFVKNTLVLLANMEDAIFFISSREALAAKQSGDAEMLKSSRITWLENRLQELAGQSSSVMQIRAVTDMLLEVSGALPSLAVPNEKNKLYLLEGEIQALRDEYKIDE